MINSSYLTQGLQTKFTERVYEHADKARNIVIPDNRIATLSEPMISVHRTCKYMSKLPYIKGYISKPRTRDEEKSNEELKDSVFRQRDLDEVLKDGHYPTCSDFGLLFRGLMAAQGHATSYVETFHENFILDIMPRESDIMGHVLGRVYFEDGHSIIVDPTSNPKIYCDEESLFWDKKYIIVGEGLDSWDIGIHWYDDMYRLKHENMKKILERYGKNLRNIFQQKFNTLKIAQDEFSEE